MDKALVRELVEHEGMKHYLAFIEELIQRDFADAVLKCDLSVSDNTSKLVALKHQLDGARKLLGLMKSHALKAKDKNV